METGLFDLRMNEAQGDWTSVTQIFRFRVRSSKTGPAEGHDN